MNNDFNISKQYSEMTIEELNNIIKDDIHLKGTEVFLAKKELELRVSISNLDKANSIRKNIRKTKIHWYHFIDYKAIYSLAFIAIFIMAITLFVNYRKSSPPTDYLEYDLVTMGIANNIEANEMLKQGLDGAHWVASMYVISYSYEVGGIEYSSKITIPGITGNTKYISFIRHNLHKKVFPIKYKSENPMNSIVDLTMLDE